MEEKDSKISAVTMILLARGLFYIFLGCALTLSISDGHYVLGIIIIALSIIPIFYLSKNEIKNKEAYEIAEGYIKRDITGIRPKFILWGLFLIGVAFFVAYVSLRLYFL